MPLVLPIAQLQAGADWLYARFYRLDAILARFARALFSLGWAQAWVGLRLGLTYRYDNLREGIVGRDPAVPERGETPLQLTRYGGRA